MKETHFLKDIYFRVRESEIGEVVQKISSIIFPEESSDWTIIDAKKEALTDEIIKEFVEGKRNF